MRIIFIHGLGETNEIFNKLAGYLPGEHEYISLWESLGNERREDFEALEFSKEFIQKYNIAKEDIIIGHSTGGRLAHFIKHLNGNTIIQIASWTQDDRPILPTPNIKLLYFLVRSGMLFSGLIMNYLFNRYKNRDSTKEYYEEAFYNLKNGNRNCVLSQFKLALEPIDEPINTSPDLRIHAKRDNVVRFPDEPFIEVPGDHFSLLTHPQMVAEHINKFLSTLR